MWGNPSLSSADGKGGGRRKIWSIISSRMRVLLQMKYLQRVVQISDVVEALGSGLRWETLFENHSVTL